MEQILKKNYRGGCGGIDGERPPGAAPGPNNICLCCWRLISSNCVFSFSIRTGAAKMMADVAIIHNAERLKLYKPLAQLIVDVLNVQVTSRTFSGNISVKPQRRSANVSSSNSSC